MKRLTLLLLLLSSPAYAGKKRLPDLRDCVGIKFYFDQVQPGPCQRVYIRGWPWEAYVDGPMLECPVGALGFVVHDSETGEAGMGIEYRQQTPEELFEICGFTGSV
jgi:hypothetical protein